MTDTALLRALLADATERPWHTGSEIDPKQVYVYFPPHFIPITLADSVLIVEAVNSLPDLLDELGRFREIASRLHAAIAGGPFLFHTQACDPSNCYVLAAIAGLPKPPRA